MANRTFNPPRALEKELITLTLQFGLNSSAAVVAANALGRGDVSVTKTSTGLYQVLLQDAYPAFMGASVEIQAGNAVTQALSAQLGDFNVAASVSTAAVTGVSSAASVAAQSIYVKTVNGSGVVTDTSVAALISLVLYLRNSTVA